MRPWRLVVLFLLWVVGGAAATAQAPGIANRVFTGHAIAAALSHAPAAIAAPQDPRSDWSRLQQLTNMEIVLFAQGLTVGGADSSRSRTQP